MMQTSMLIDQLAAQAPKPPLRSRRLMALLLSAIILCGGLFLMLLGPRANALAMLAQPLVMPKTLLPAIMCLIALPLLIQTIRPGAAPRLQLLLLPVLAALPLWLGTFIMRAPDQRFADVTGWALLDCVGLILLLSAPLLSVAIMLLRRGATTRPALTGALAGLTASAGAATGYSLFCTQDNPLFYLTWYGVAIAIIVLIGALAGRRFLAW